MTPETVTFLTSKEVAQKLNVTKDKLKRMPITFYRLPHHNLYALQDVESFDQQIEVDQPALTKTTAILSRDDFADWIRSAPATVKHWGHRGHGPVFHRGTSKSDPSNYPLKLVQAWLVSCRVVATAEAA